VSIKQFQTHLSDNIEQLASAALPPDDIKNDKQEDNEVHVSSAASHELSNLSDEFLKGVFRESENEERRLNSTRMIYHGSRSKKFGKVMSGLRSALLRYGQHYRRYCQIEHRQHRHLPLSRHTFTESLFRGFGVHNGCQQVHQTLPRNGREGQ
jgi:hypothetical protein